MSPRPRSDAGGTLMHRHARAGSTPQRTGGPFLGAVAAAKAAQESAVLTAVRRQVEAVEEKLNSQLARVQQQGDRLRDAAFSRVDAKMGSMEALQPRFDRKLAELSGNYKGLSDEMQAQIRRVDQMDTRLWEWRHQLEDEVRSKFSEAEQAQQQMQSQQRLASATTEDSLKRMASRVRRLETLLEERLAFGEEAHQCLQALDSRLQEIENARISELALPLGSPLGAAGPGPAAPDPAQAEPLGGPGGAAALDARFAEVWHKVDTAGQDFQDVQARVEAQEERLRSLRTLLETKDEQFRSSKFDRQDWENRSKELTSLVQDLDRHRLEHSERLEVFQRRFENQEKSGEELSDSIRRISERAYASLAEAGSLNSEQAHYGHNGTDVAARSVGPEDGVNNIEDCVWRLGSAEERLSALEAEAQCHRSDSELAPRVAALVDSLKQVAPKVMDQEACVRELHEKVGTLEAKAAMLPEHSKAAEAMGQRLGKLEVDMLRLKTEVEGEPDAAARAQ